MILENRNNGRQKPRWYSKTSHAAPGSQGDSASAGLISIRSVLAWGLLNAALLSVGAAGLQLWAHHPLPRESLTIYILMCGQITVASLGFPAAATPLTLLINLAFLLPVDELGGLLSNLDQITTLKCVLGVGIWITGLGMWRVVAKGERGRMLIAATASCFCLGGAILDYLRWEAAALENRGGSFEPLSLLPQLCGLHFLPLFWLQASLPMILAVFWFLGGYIAKSSSTSLHKRPVT